MATQSQTTANQKNAEASTGPRTEAGRQASSMNALSHGLTSMKALLPGDSADAYEQLVTSHFSRYSPATDEERELVQFIADGAWRLSKVTAREVGVYEIGRLTHAETLFTEEKDPARRAALIESKIALIYEKELKNLRLQERRLRNQHTGDIAKLKEIQQERIDKPQREARQSADENIATVQRAADIANRCKTHNVAFQPTDFGFVFSTDEWTHYCDRQATHFLLCGEVLDLNRVIAAYRQAAAA